MPEGMRSREATALGKGSASAREEARSLAGDPERLAAINAMRAPSEQIVPSPLCGAAKAKRAGGARKGGVGSTRYADSDTCTHPAGMGTAHTGFGFCKFHGGNTPAGNKGAARAWGRMLLSNTKFGGDLTITDITAEEALLEEVRRSVAMVRWLEERIGNFGLDPSRVEIGGLPALVEETSRGAASSTDVQAWLLLYREERGHMIRASKTAIDAGIAERMVRIAEEQGNILASAIRAVLAALNLSPEQASLVPQVVPRILRSLAEDKPMEILPGEVED